MSLVGFLKFLNRDNRVNKLEEGFVKLKEMMEDLDVTLTGYSDISLSKCSCKKRSDLESVSLIDLKIKDFYDKLK